MAIQPSKNLSNKVHELECPGQKEVLHKHCTYDKKWGDVGLK